MTENKPRYSRVSDILDLAIFMSSKIQGVTINEIAQRYNVSRRTAERMRDSLTCIFPSVDEIETKESQKHWGFINYSISHLISFTSKEIGNLEQLQRRITGVFYHYKSKVDNSFNIFYCPMSEYICYDKLVCDALHQDWNDGFASITLEQEEQIKFLFG